jgi:hypothetical protein
MLRNYLQESISSYILMIVSDIKIENQKGQNLEAKPRSVVAVPG